MISASTTVVDEAADVVAVVLDDVDVVLVDNVEVNLLRLP